MTKREIFNTFLGVDQPWDKGNLLKDYLRIVRIQYVQVRIRRLSIWKERYVTQFCCYQDIGGAKITQLPWLFPCLAFLPILFLVYLSSGHQQQQTFLVSHSFLLFFGRIAGNPFSCSILLVSGRKISNVLFGEDFVIGVVTCLTVSCS